MKEFKERTSEEAKIFGVMCMSAEVGTEAWRETVRTYCVDDPKWLLVLEAIEAYADEQKPSWFSRVKNWWRVKRGGLSRTAKIFEVICKFNWFAMAMYLSGRVPEQANPLRWNFAMNAAFAMALDEEK